MPYRPLDVLVGGNKVDGVRWWVRDDDGTWWWMVEYVGRPGRLTCYCDDGVAHSEAPETEDPCAHLRAVVDQRMADQRPSRPSAPVNAGSFCD